VSQSYINFKVTRYEMADAFGVEFYSTEGDTLKVFSTGDVHFKPDNAERTVYINEQVEYEYETEILASSVHVHESWGAPFVQSVAVVDSAGAESSIWAGTDSTACGSALSVSVSNPIATKKVKVYTQSSDYEHVNAVQLCGIPTPPAAPPPSPSPPWPPLQPQSCEWADAATASSQYSSSCNKGRSQNACEATGAQNVSGCADAAGAWSPASSVSSEEWLQLTFPTYVIVGSVVIYETYKSKFVLKVELRDAAEMWHTVFDAVDGGDTDDTSCPGQLTVALGPSLLGIGSRTVKITTATSGYEQIDAVQLCGSPVPPPPQPPPSPPSPPSVPPPCAVEIDVVMVLDNSGSVGAQRPDVLNFARAVVGFFTMGSSEAQIGYVEFEETAYKLSDLTPDLSTISSAINGAPAVGSGTFISGGLALGQTTIEGTNARSGVKKVIILMTDGVQTVGGDDRTAIAAATTVKDAGIEVIGVMFGGASESTMSQMVIVAPAA